MKRTIDVLLVCLLAAGVVSTASSAHAELGRDALKCRETLSKRALKLVAKAMKARVDCHRLRSAGTVPLGVDCNDLFQADPARTLMALGNRLRADAEKACATSSAAALGYLACPAPCRHAAPAITDFANVADCVLCLVEAKTHTISVNGQGLPSSVLDGPSLACHAAIGKAQSRYVRTLLTERRKCQTAAERDGTSGLGACAASDPGGKIAKAASKGRTAFRRACRDAEVTALDSCSFFSLANVEECVFDTATTSSNDLFRHLYALDGAPGYTTTTSASSTTTMTSTTTLGDGGATCQVTLRATTTELLGALRYEVDYSAALGDFVGSGINVTCTNLVAGASASFFDNDAGLLRESMISLAGFNTPVDLARCTLETERANVSAADFTIAVLDASTPDLMPANPTVVVGSITCTPS